MKIVVDDREIQVQSNQMLIDAMDLAGINIPRFCYHKHLSVAANCRMCLVEIVGHKKEVPSCATAVSDGMVVKTQSKEIRRTQKSVMEFLLINHPLDCPICDQGGECELQDVSLQYGSDISRFSEKKRVVSDKNIGPLIHTDLTRCIHCTRCIRFGREIAGISELGMYGRGEHSEIGAVLEKSVDSELSGNMIDICPVGALTSKPFRYSARAWELKSRPIIMAHDSLGSNAICHVKDEQIKRVVPAENDQLNEVWLSDRDRFSYEGMNHPSRLLSPQIKKDNCWQNILWEEALPHVASLLQQAEGDIATVISPSATLEDMFLAQSLTRALGSHNIDHRIHQKDFSQQDKWPVSPHSPVKLQSLEQSDFVFLIGSDLSAEHPMVAHRLRKIPKRFTSKKSQPIWQLNPTHVGLSMKNEILCCPEEGWCEYLAGVYKAACSYTKNKAIVQPKNLSEVEVTPNKQQLKLAKALMTSQNQVILLGNIASQSANSSNLIGWCQLLSEISGANWVLLPIFANSVGAWVSGCVPHRLPGGIKNTAEGDTLIDMMGKRYHTILSIGLELGTDIALQAKHIISLTTHKTQMLDQHADIMLPISCTTETAGTLINLQGQWQSFDAAVLPPGECKPTWKILRVLGNQLNLPDFEYHSCNEVLNKLKEAIPATSSDWSPIEPVKPTQVNQTQLEKSLDKPSLFYRVPPSAIDMVVRHAKALQSTKKAQQEQRILVHPDTAKQWNLTVHSVVKLWVKEKAYALELSFEEGIATDKLQFPALIALEQETEPMYFVSYTSIDRIEINDLFWEQSDF